MKFNLFKPNESKAIAESDGLLSVGRPSFLSKALSFIFPPKVKKDQPDSSPEVARPSLWYKVYCIILNKKPVSSSDPAAALPPAFNPAAELADEQQIKAIKAHLLPLKLFTKINRLLTGLVFISLIFLFILIFEHLSLYPLVETQYNYAEFVGSDHNFVNVVHTKHIDNERLIESLLRRYVVEREQIIKKPSQLVEKFSSPNVYEQYFQIIKTISERDLRSKVRRFIKILRYQKIESNIRQIEVEFTDLIKKPNNKDSRINKSIWLINIKYEFLDTLRRYNEVAINPAGLMITIYNIKRQS